MNLRSIISLILSLGFGSLFGFGVFSNNVETLSGIVETATVKFILISLGAIFGAYIWTWVYPLLQYEDLFLRYLGNFLTRFHSYSPNEYDRLWRNIGLSKNSAGLGFIIGMYAGIARGWIFGLPIGGLLGYLSFEQTSSRIGRSILGAIAGYGFIVFLSTGLGGSIGVFCRGWLREHDR